MPRGRILGAVQILNTLAPVFLLIAVGAALEKRHLVPPGFFKAANRLTYWLGLPALLLSQLAGSLHVGYGAAGALSAVLIATAGILALSYLVAWALRTPGATIGTFVQGCFRGNLAFVGLPVIFLAPDVMLPGGASSRSAAILAIAPMLVLYNLVGVVVLLLSQHRFGWAMLKPFLKQLASTPPLHATIAGIAFALLGWPLPAFVDKALTALGDMALPLGLLGVGSSLVTTEIGTRWARPLAAALVKTVAAPAIGWMVGRALGLAREELFIVLVLLACPTAIISYTMAVELKGDEHLAAGTIVLSVVLSMVSLAAIVAWF